MIVDSTGLSVMGAGEWAAAKHGGRGTRGGETLHLGVDGSGVPVAHVLTHATVDDATYDTVAFREAASARHARVVVPPTRTAKVSRRVPRSRARDRTTTDVETLGRRQWQKAAGDHRQARGENAVFRYKSIIGDGLRARGVSGRDVEASRTCRILNQMTALGRPESHAINR